MKHTAQFKHGQKPEKALLLRICTNMKITGELLNSISTGNSDQNHRKALLFSPTKAAAMRGTAVCKLGPSESAGGNSEPKAEALQCLPTAKGDACIQ